MRIAYPYHPRCGETVVVLGSKQHAGAAHVVIRQADGTLSLLPKWMTDPAASSSRMLLRPRFPAKRLADLRRLIDALLEPPGEGNRFLGR